MKQQAKIIAAAVTLALGALSAGQVSAAGISNVSYSANNEYLGALNSLTSDFAQLDRQNITASITAGNPDIWVFDFGPIGSVTSTISFNPFDPGTGFSAFNVALYNVAGTTGNVTNTIAGNFTTVTLGSLINPGGPTFLGSDQNGSAFNFTPIAAGRYALVITATLAGAPVQYQGSINTRQVPEPGSLALAGLALFGAAVAMRKRKVA